MKPLALQTRITLWAGAVVACTFLVVAIASSVFLYHETVKNLDKQLDDLARKCFKDLSRRGGVAKINWENSSEINRWLPLMEPPLYIEIARKEGGRTLFRSKNLGRSPVPAFPRGFKYSWIGNDRIRLGTFSEAGIILRLGADLDRIDKLSQDLAACFMIALPIMLGFVLIGGRWIAHKTLRPIREITESAEQVNAQHLDQRVPVPEANDEIQRLAIALNGTLERLEASFHQAMRFSADASHELKTPLTVVRTSLDALLSSPTLNEVDQPAVAELIEQTNRISSITSGLLLLARADAGRLILNLQPIDFGEIIELCCVDAQIVAEPANISIAVERPPSVPVRGDRTRLMQIVSNLLDNAIKYNNTGGCVRVSLKEAPGVWELEIANTGPGVAPEHLAHIFERFFRSQHFEHVSGHGLGLSLSRELARAHGGELELVKSDSQWTIFRFKLPSPAFQPA